MSTKCNSSFYVVAAWCGISQAGHSQSMDDVVNTTVSNVDLSDTSLVQVECIAPPKKKKEFMFSNGDTVELFDIPSQMWNGYDMADLNGRTATVIRRNETAKKEQWHVRIKTSEGDYWKNKEPSFRPKHFKKVSEEHNQGNPATESLTQTTESLTQTGELFSDEHKNSDLVGSESDSDSEYVDAREEFDSSPNAGTPSAHEDQVQSEELAELQAELMQAVQVMDAPKIDILNRKLQAIQGNTQPRQDTPRLPERTNSGLDRDAQILLLEKQIQAEIEMQEQLLFELPFHKQLEFLPQLYHDVRFESKNDAGKEDTDDPTKGFHSEVSATKDSQSSSLSCSEVSIFVKREDLDVGGVARIQGVDGVLFNISKFHENRTITVEATLQECEVSRTFQNLHDSNVTSVEMNFQYDENNVRACNFTVQVDCDKLIMEKKDTH